MPSRVDVIRGKLRERKADCVLLTFMPDIRWAVGFTGSNAMLAVSHKNVHLLTDGRYAEQAAQEVFSAKIHIGSKLIEVAVDNAVLPTNATCLLQGDHVTLATHRELERAFPKVNFITATNLLVENVASKSEDEITLIKEAQSITDAVFTDIVPLIRPGVTELDLSAEIVYQHLKRGCERMAFDPIVASGVRSALPHARPTPAQISSGDMVVIDMGGVRNGYASDMTRTVAVAEPGETARKVYQIVLDAQDAALEAARADMAAKDLDAAARKVIASAGYAEAFAHSLGHGIGLQTHEWPRVASTSEDILRTNTTITVEPGIYLAGQFGVRIEDIIVLKENGSENLTRSSKELLVV
ncbi:MAG: aminopeptidase P family protein [Rubricoccaceae bacterium]|nr:aminopeptidase P family protein [Rubricoccaceae bacterium]